jgi:SAM-dependent methyltransferase
MTVQQYQALGVLDEELLIKYDHYIQQLSENIGQIPPAHSGAKALEIGGGISPYAGLLLKLGYRYTLVEPSKPACEFMEAYFPGITTYPSMFGSVFSKLETGGYDVIVSAHSLEHMKDAPLALSCMARLLSPSGVLYLIVPDDEDLMNPGHYWFFNEASIRITARLAGLKVNSLKVQRIVHYEKFIYCSLSLEN